MIRPAIVRLVVTGLLIGSTLFGASNAWAKKGLVMEPWVADRLSKAGEALGEKRYADAKKELDGLAKKKSLNPHERAQMWQAYAGYWGTRGNYKQAAKSLVKSLANDAEGLHEPAVHYTHKALAELYVATEQYAKAVRFYVKWLKEEKKPKPKDKFFLGAALDRLGKPERALKWVKAAADSPNPKEAWLQTLLSIYVRLKKNKEMVPVLEKLVSRYPKRTYWLQLYAATVQVGNQTRANAIMEVVHEQGFLEKESELLGLVGLRLSAGMPLRGAKLLEESMASGKIEKTLKNQRFLAEAWIQASERKKAIAVLTKIAPKLRKSELYVQLGYLNMEEQKWAKAAQAYQRAIALGKVKQVGQVYVFLGISLYRANNLNGAAKAFRVAQNHKVSKSAAKAWLQTVQAKRDRG